MKDRESQQHRDGNADQSEPNSLAACSADYRDSNGDDGAESAKDRAKRTWRRWQRAGIIVNIITSVLVAWFTYNLVSLTGQQAKIADKQTHIIDEQRRIMAAEQRPWVLFDPTPSSEKTYFNRAWHESIKLHVTNFGKGPAFRVRWSLWSPKNPNDPIWKTTPIPHHGWARSRGQSTLGPGDTLQIHVGWQYGFPTPRQLPNGTVHVLLLVRYFDTSGEPHRTLICIGGGVDTENANELHSCLTYDIAE